MEESNISASMWTCPQCGEVCPFGPNGSADCGFELCPYAEPEDEPGEPNP